MAWEHYNAQGDLKTSLVGNPLPAMVPISDTVLSGAQASVTVNVPSNYAHLKVLISGRTDLNANKCELWIRFNADSGANYQWRWDGGGASAVQAGSGDAAAGIQLGYLAAATATASYIGESDITIFNANGTTFFKAVRASTGHSDSAATSGPWDMGCHGMWRSTAAITSVTLYPNSGNFIAGTRVTVYGLLPALDDGVAPGAVVPVGYSTTLPGSPLDGQEHILVDSTSAPTYQWRLRYNAGSANTDKWEYIGGSAALINVQTEETTTSGSYVDVATVGPTFTAPRAGFYTVQYNVTLKENVASIHNKVTFVVNGTADLTNEAEPMSHATAGGRTHAVGGPQITARLTAASQVIKLQYKTDGTNIMTVSRRMLSVAPIRVS